MQEVACACRANLDADGPGLDRDVEGLLAEVDLGSKTSLARLYDRTSPRLLSIVSAILPELADAESILQEVYLAVWGHRGGKAFVGRRGMPWLAAMARTRAVDLAERRSTETGRTTAPRVAVVPAATRMPSHTTSVQAASSTTCLRTLQGGPRDALSLVYREGLSKAELATRLGEANHTVKRWLRAGLDSLRVPPNVG